MRWLKISALLACAGVTSLPAHAATALADQPLFATKNVPGNLALLLSVEFPTAVSVAHTNRTYSSASTYLGYFDPNKCYEYRYTDGTSTDNYFYPTGLATTHTCTSRWSGNFLNWASMQTIDPFRWALTGGYRVIDTAALTVIEKAWATGQGGAGNFPNGSLGSSLIAGATPFPATTAAFNMRIQGLGNKMRFTVPGGDGSAASFTAEYFNNKTLTGVPVLTRTESTIAYATNGSWPSPVVNTTDLSARWTGTATAPTAGAYRFRVRADDGVRLWINGTPLAGDPGWRDQGATNYDSAVYNFTAGQVFTIKVEFYQGGGPGEISLLWEKPGDTVYSILGSGALASVDNAGIHYNPATTPTGGVVYEVFMRAKVCDSSLLEANCTAYGSNYKPEGLMQKYANKIRYSAFGYLNDSNVLRDGGVLRARQKFVGPTQPVPGSSAVPNLREVDGGPVGQVTGGEWDASTGVFALNPDATDASNTAAIMGLASGSGVTNSGVINYLNKFGELTPGAYKTYDNVGELYYAAIRYFRNLPNVPEWTNVPTATSNATRVTWTDGFPVITAPADPILYSCQRNFILGIGDTNTHADKNVPGNTSTANEPTIPATITADEPTVNAVTMANYVGVREGLGASLGTTYPYNGCCTNNSALMAGLAYWAHVKDIRPTLDGKQTIDTYWVDVQEYQTYAAKNQFYLATKYGGFSVPEVPLVYDETATAALPLASWSTSGDMNNGTDSRPDNYFSGGRPDLMIAGLDAAFRKIAASITAYTTSFSTSLPQVALAGNSSFSSKYDPNNWTGEIAASNLSFDATTGDPSLELKWTFTDLLATQIGGTGWDTNRRVATWNGSAGVAFRATGTSAVLATDLALLDTSYVTVDDRADYLNYLRGDRTKEINAVAAASRVYRTRPKLLGDIVGSKARPVGPPRFPFSDATNPGYAAFKATWASRRTVVYFGSNDGMMHAVNGALVTAATTPPLETDAAAGTEMFAYVPRALYQGPNGTPNVDGLASLGNPSFSHHYLVNATPSVFDIDFARVPDTSNLPQTPAVTTFNWRSVLIGGLGKGGRTYYAMDVTDPVSMVSGGESVVASKVLWEFSHPALGYTYGDPVVVKTRKYGWVVIFVSGYNNVGGTGFPAGQGYFLIVNPKTGALLEVVSTGVGSATSDAGLAHANAFVIDASDGTADSIYGGDLLGNLWRLDLTAATGAYPAPTKVAELTDSSGVAQPVTSRPSIEVHPSTKKRFVMVGTGKLLDTSDIASTQRQNFYAIVDGTNATFTATPASPLAFPYTRSVLANNANALVGVTFDPATQAGWYEDLGVDVSTPATTTPPVPAHTGTGIAWRITSESSTLSGSVAFVATLPNGSVCSPSGDSRVYARDYAAAVTTVRDDANLATLFVSVTGNVTDLRYLSVRGRAELISGTDIGTVSQVNINPVSGLQLRRLNWRELQVVD